MSRISGRAGNVVLSGDTVGYITSWSYDAAADEIEVTAMNDDGKQYVGGLTDGSGAIEARFDYSGTSQDVALDILEAGTQVSLALYPLSGGTHYLSGSSVVITSYGISASYSDAMNVSFGYRGKLAWVGP